MKRNENGVPFVIQRNILKPQGEKNCRQKLQNRFDNDDDPNTAGSTSEISEKSDRSVLSVLSLNDPGRMFRSGAQKISKSFSSFRTTIGSLSQKFRPATKRRQLLEEGPSTPCITPQTHSKQILGRTPTKLYSPFGIESPRNQQMLAANKENIPNLLRKNKMKKDHKTYHISKHSQDVFNDDCPASSSFFR